MTAPTFDTATLGGRIGYALEAAGLERKDLARAAGVSLQAVGQWINDQTKNLRNEHLFSIADLTGFSARWLATGDGPQHFIYSDDARIAHVVKVMEALPSYARDEAVKSFDSVAELVRRAQAAQHGGKVSNGD